MAVLRFVAALACLAVPLGCAAALPPPKPAPSTLALHASGAPQHVFGSGWGYTASVDIGYAAVGCCGVGFYAGRSTLFKPDDADRDPEAVKHLLEGGLEGSVVVPGTQDQVRLLVRAGRAGTRPQAPLLGRTGYAVSAALLYRPWPSQPRVSDGVANLDFFLGSSSWWLGRERSPAGPYDHSWSEIGVSAGVRVGFDYGLDLD